MNDSFMKNAVLDPSASYTLSFVGGTSRRSRKTSVKAPMMLVLNDAANTCLDMLPVKDPNLRQVFV